MKKKIPPVQPKLRLRDRRRRLLWVKVGVVASVAIVALGASYAVLRMPEISISNIEVTGTTASDPALIKNIADEKLRSSYGFVIPKRNVAFAPLSEVEKGIVASFPIVKSASVSRSGLTGLAIVVSERSPSAAWCEPSTEEVKGKCFLMDENGFIYAFADEVHAHLIYGGMLDSDPVGSTYLRGAFPALSKFVSDTASALGKTPKSLFVEQNNDVTLAFKEGGELKFVMSEDSAGTLENIASVFATQKLKGRTDFEYADFRFGNKVYVKFKE